MAETDRRGSAKDLTWDRYAKEHRCCRSRAVWQHKIGCPALKGQWGELKDGLPALFYQYEQEIEKLKNLGFTSGQIASRLNLSLSDTNIIYARIPMVKEEQPFERK